MKLPTIQACLETQFRDVTFNQKLRPTSTFHQGDCKMSWLLVLNSEFLNDQSMSLDVLRGFIKEKVLKKVHANPGKRIQVSKYWDITVEEKIFHSGHAADVLFFGIQPSRLGRTPSLHPP